jgi:hypothetical protein
MMGELKNRTEDGCSVIVAKKKFPSVRIEATACGIAERSLLKIDSWDIEKGGVSQ